MINFLILTFYLLGRLTLTFFLGSVICSLFSKSLICHLSFVQVSWNRLFLCWRNNVLAKIQGNLGCVTNHHIIFSWFCDTSRRIFFYQIKVKLICIWCKSIRVGFKMAGHLLTLIKLIAITLSYQRKYIMLLRRSSNDLQINQFEFKEKCVGFLINSSIAQSDDLKISI